MLSFTTTSIAAITLLCPLVRTQATLPQVDLGYEIHRAIGFNQTGQTYNFSNIRYAQPPIGDLRFAAPVPPTGRNNVVQNGSVDRICPQALPAWYPISAEFVQDLIAGNASSFNLTQAEEQLQIALQNAKPAPPDPRTTEDCLFLDVIVPKKVFDGSKSRIRRRQNSGAAVVVWIYGGGYTLGSKEGSGNPSGLIKASQANGGEGIIFVAMNYRLGAMGWLAGPTLQAAGGVSNAGLYDQRLALEWVQKYIHLFGGDPNRVTVMGESAGGGSVVHQITAYGGQKGVPFQQAIPQSPGYLPMPSYFVQENITQTFLSLLNVSTIQEARQVSSAAIIKANALQVGASNYGGFTYGPAVDGVFVPALPGTLLNAGQFAKNVSVMVSHMLSEGPAFTPPNVRTDDQLEDLIVTLNPETPAPAVNTIVKTLYPAIYNGSQPYTSPIERTILFVTESSFTCNAYYLNKAYGNKTYAYQFAVPPGFHGYDVQYTFYNGQPTNLTQDMVAPVAKTLQAYLTNFIMTGNPNGQGLPPFPMQGTNASMNSISTTVTRVKDDTSNQRCAWWEKSLFT
ncbi:uncharacterized protein Z520_06632 [Fonsecaea multimorphosa CBS 102226]|uniref:Carboxylic ester hydrolase n=1 Tax=Fonsecaea multimorphosa CBS 102226 TaxID=1442371 RepID=A0A0D2K3V2_9EURO|nr:uncharacterized protein Z520_06632 [Fonsecaea multimorphosa CBS 102226]KIX97854.1 hypothetical protein Z520_06632 [Fonsecaea multimorphosa CBS 102226]OAL23622.1 hypothetical protein AYO22_06199 [Fonsecaea multimorphosa]